MRNLGSCILTKKEKFYMTNNDSFETDSNEVKEKRLPDLAIKKRGRGRPRKSTAVDQMTSPVNQMTSPVGQMTSPVSQTGEPLARRKRGTPPSSLRTATLNPNLKKPDIEVGDGEETKINIVYVDEDPCTYDMRKLISQVPPDLEKITWLNYRNAFLIDPVNGRYKEGRTTRKIPPPLFLNNQEDIWRYYFIYAHLKCELLVATDTWVQRFIEASIRNFVKRADHKSTDPYTLVPTVKGYAISRSDAVLLLFKSMSLSKDLLFVGDSVREYKVYRYQKGTPPYREVTPGEVVKTLWQWLKSIFASSIPQELTNRAALEKLARYLGTNSLISKKSFEESNLMGVPFEDVFASVVPPHPTVIPLSYDERVFALEVLPVKYTPVTFDGDQVVISKVTKLFLENLTSNSQYKYNVLRGFCRILITAAREGRNFQTCLWVSGPPGTMKSTWPNFVKLLVDPRRVQEQAKQITPFTSGQLENCHLLILSDVQSISKDVVGLLKALVGRDSIALQQKYVQDIHVINPCCQVMIVSNFPPEHFPDVWNDEGMMSPIIHVEFSDSDRIPPELQISNLSDYLKPMMSDIFNWCIHAPSELFLFHVRNQFYKFYRQLEQKKPTEGFACFIEEKFVYDTSSEAFIPNQDIDILLRDYVQETADPIVEDFLKRKIAKREMSVFLPMRVLEAFGKKITHTRWSSRRNFNEVYDRPYGFRNLARKEKSKEGKVQLTNTQELFVRKSEFDANLPPLPDAFYTSQKISWIETNYEDFSIIQEEISQRRKITAPDMETAEEGAGDDQDKNQSPARVGSTTSVELNKIETFWAQFTLKNKK